tara:strand:+ start:1466 stop:1729 length:264 start_codon:yes stop_codon:yes gene_type:complete
MNQGYYDLDKPIEKVVRSEMIKFSINNLVCEPFDRATMSVMLLDESNSVVDGMYLILEGEEYKLWVSDEYLISWVKLQINNKYNTIL